VILLQNSNEWNLSLAKEGSSREREREEQGLKRKRGETSVEKLHVLRKKDRIKFRSCWERFYQKKERRSQFSIVQNLMCDLIDTHTSFAFALPSIP
jgi:hypothetical protein